MDRLFQNDRLVKVLSVVLAVLLWFTVSASQTKQEEIAFDHRELRVYPPPPEYMILEGPRQGEQTVRILARGSRLQLSRIDPNKLEAYVDYSAVARSGTREAIVVVQPVAGSSLPAGVQLLAEPARVPVYIPKSMERTLPVRVFPSPGQFVMDGRDAQYTAVANPAQVVVSGPEEFVSRVAQLQVNLQEQEVTRAGAISKQPVAVDDRNVIVEYVQVPTVDVEVSIQVLPPAKTVLVRPSFRGALPDGHQYTVSVEPQAIKIRGDVSLAGIEDVRTEPIDLSGKTESFETNVRVLPPSGTTADEEMITVTVTIAEVEIERTLDAMPIQVAGQATNTTVTVAPAEAQVRLRGFKQYLDQVNRETFVPYVDVEGLSTGTHMLPVKFQPAGQGVEVFALEPRMVEVMIEEIATQEPPE